MNLLKRTQLLNLFYRLRIFDILHRIRNRRKLTVLAYHRINNPYAPNFDTFTPNVSANPAQFTAQMAYLARRYSVVSIDDVTAWLRGEQSLPDYPALITFDDGYFDNFKYAMPILKKFGFPAIVFLATDYIGKSKPFFWDFAAYCFFHTDKTSATFPLAGELHWHNAESRTLTLVNWLNQLKTISDTEKWAHIHNLPNLLNVAVPDDAFAGTMMTWTQVKEMIANNVAMGAHTMSHPVLTRVSSKQARAEIIGSKACIEAEAGVSVTAFAYPNGLAADFTAGIQRDLASTKIEVAFTLLPGPASFAEIQENTFAIRRIFLSHKDSFPRFVAKLTGLPRMIGLPH